MQTALQWFWLTHELQVSEIGARWSRTAWPAQGGAGDQDARLVEQLQMLRAVFNQVLREQRARAREQAELEAWRKRLQLEG